MKRTEPTRTGTEEHRKVADSKRGDTVANPKTLRDTEFRDLWMDVLSRNSGKVKENPGRTGVGAPGPGSNLDPTCQERDEVCLTIPDLPPEVAEEDARRYIVGVLDDLRKQGDSYHINKPRWMLTAHKYGLSYAEIAVVLRMSEGAVRKACNRAKKSPDYVGGA